jgi:hypothetical protein
MAKQTINIGASPNDGTGTPLRTSFDYCNLNFTELYTATGPSGNNIVVPGTATITGALTIGGATSFPASVINTSGGNPVFTPTAATLFLYSGSSFLSIRNQANTQEIFNLTPAGVYTFGDGAGGTRMTLNSTGLAIGDTAFSGTRLTLRESATNPNALAMTNRNATQTWRIGVDVAAVDDKILGFYDSTSATFRMQLTDTGNLGIGVTPSVWTAGFKAFQVGAGSALWTNNTITRTSLTTNFYYNGSDLFIGNGYAHGYWQDGTNGHRWFTSSVANASGAGASATMNQAMTLATNGQLLLGTTSTSGVIDTAMVMDKSSGSGFVGNVYRMGGVDKGYSYLASASTSMLYETVTGYVIRMVSATNGVYLANGGTSWLAISDERFKDIIEPISNAVAKVGSLRSVIGKFKSEAEGTRRSFLIAQDVQAVLPEAVDSTNPNELAVSYTDVIPLLVAAIKELTAEVNALKKA